MQTKNKIIEVVVGIIRNENKEILIAKRQQDQFMPNYWELPGGKIEVGEDSFSALSRELYEEIGITVKDCSLITKSVTTIQTRRLIYQYTILKTP